MSAKNEQWNLEGDCSRCRRQSYCKKPCKHGISRKRAKAMVAYIAYIESAMQPYFAKDSKEGEDGRTL